jgi:hypothetical protein
MWVVMTYGSAIVLDAITPDNQICDGIGCAGRGFQIVGLSVIAGFCLAAFSLYVIVKRLEFRARPTSQPTETKMP